MSPPHGSSSSGWKDLRNGAVLQSLEAMTIGLPLEVWKTRMGRMRQEGVMESFANIYKRGGVQAYWAGLVPKVIESASKGAVLLWAKELFTTMFDAAGLGKTATGLLAGAAGGVAQVSVMGPCTFLVTAAVTGDKSVSLFSRISQVYKAKGFSGFYAGSTAVALRQGTNWASREGFTVFVRESLRNRNHGGDPKAKLTIGEEMLAATIGGGFSCWNHPFEVLRIEMQATGSDINSKKLSLTQTAKMIYSQQGFGGFFRGIQPRILLGIYQTFFMVTIAKLIKERGWL